MFSKLFFLYCALMIVTTALLAVRFRNPVYSVLSVLVMFFHVAALYLMLNAEFLAAIQVIVYAGAILVLYLFVLFLVSLKKEIRIEQFIANNAFGTVISICLGVCLLYIIPSFKLGAKGDYPVEKIKELGHTKAMGFEMFTTHILPFEIAGLILLIAVIGGLVLARKDKQPQDESLAAGTCPSEVKK